MSSSNQNDIINNQEYDDLLKDVSEVTPENLSKILFSKLPADPCSISLLPMNDDNQDEPLSFEFIFEILLAIYMEGIIDVTRLYQMLSENRSIQAEDNINIYKKKLDLTHINLDVLNVLTPWFLSFGYMINIHEFIQNEDDIINEYGLNNYYCKIILRENPEDFGVFFMRQIEKPFHFIINGKYEQDEIKNISDLYAVFFLPKNKNDPLSKKKLFTITFSPFNKN